MEAALNTAAEETALQDAIGAIMDATRTARSAAEAIVEATMEATSDFGGLPEAISKLVENVAADLANAETVEKMEDFKISIKSAQENMAHAKGFLPLAIKAVKKDVKDENISAEEGEKLVDALDELKSDLREISKDIEEALEGGDGEDAS